MALFMFDIDETILILQSRLNEIDGGVKCDISLFNPYTELGDTDPEYRWCYAINKRKMAEVFNKILENGHEIGFVTAGQITKRGIRKYIQIEYGIDLGVHFLHYTKAYDKTVVLKKLAQERQCSYKDIYLVDNLKEQNIDPAAKAGFATVHVDIGENEKETYITKLNAMVDSLTQVGEIKPTVVPHRKGGFFDVHPMRAIKSIDLPKIKNPFKRSSSVVV